MYYVDKILHVICIYMKKIHIYMGGISEVGGHKGRHCSRPKEESVFVMFPVCLRGCRAKSLGVD